MDDQLKAGGVCAKDCAGRSAVSDPGLNAAVYFVPLHVAAGKREARLGELRPERLEEPDAATQGTHCLLNGWLDWPKESKPVEGSSSDRS